jgi:hypothetical protein
VNVDQASEVVDGGEDADVESDGSDDDTDGAGGSAKKFAGALELHVPAPFATPSPGFGRLRAARSSSGGGGGGGRGRMLASKALANAASTFGSYGPAGPGGGASVTARIFHSTPRSIFHSLHFPVVFHSVPVVLFIAHRHCRQHPTTLNGGSLRR